jgi:nicotinamide mononucleotide transporter
MQTLVMQIRALSPAESLAVVLAIAYLLLVIRQNIWCWVCAGLSSTIYVWLLADAKLYMQSILYAFYVAMAVYGWISWRGGAEGDAELPIRVWPFKTHLFASAVMLVFATATGWWLSSYTQAAYPYVDSMTAYAAIWATYLVARKIFENWWYWLIIDIVSIGIFWSRGLELTAALFVLYVILIPVGMLQWWKTYRAQSEHGS